MNHLFRGISCDKKLSPQFHVRQIWTGSFGHCDDHILACPVAYQWNLEFFANNVSLIPDPRVGALQNAFAKYSAAARRKRQVYQVLVANQDEGESRYSEYQPGE